MGRADFSSNGQAAIQLSNQQRIYFNSSVSIAGRGGDPSGVYTPFFSNVLGTSYITHDVDGTSEYMDIQVGATHHLRMRATGPCTWTGNLNVSNGLNVNAGNSSFAADVNLAGAIHFTQPDGRIYLSPSNTKWIEYNDASGHIRVTVNSGASYVNLV